MSLNINLKKSKLKLSASVIALTASLGMLGDVLGMETVNLVDGQAINFDNFNQENPDNLYKKVTGRDTFFLEDDAKMDSVSCIFTNNLKYDASERRLLSLDGGGIRGLLEIMELAVLEKIMNLEENDAIRMSILEKNFGVTVLDLDENQDPNQLIKNITIACKLDYKKTNMLCSDLERRIEKSKKNNNGRIPVYIRDFFDTAAGTSTGSILAAGLFTNKPKGNGENLTTIDIAKLYFRYGYKIFDIKKRYGDNKITSKYNNDGLIDMLELYFGKETTIKEGVYKPIYIATYNETMGKGTLFSTDDRPLEPLANKITLLDATLSSSSAPTYFDAHEIIIDGKKYQMCDGGTFHNNPSHIAYSTDLDIIDASPIKNDVLYGIYSLGAGSVERTNNDIRSYNAGEVHTAPYIIPDMMSGTTESDIILCKESVLAKRQPVDCFVRLNPKLESGMDLLDVTTPEYITYMTKKAMHVTEGNVFKAMCQKLGLSVPNSEKFKEIQASILSEMYHLEHKNWGSLDRLEKEYVLRKIDESDFSFYENVKKDLGEENTHVFIQNIVQYYKENYINKGIVEKASIFANYAFTSLIWGENDPEKKLELGQNFHQKTNDKNILKPMEIGNIKALEGTLDIGLGFGYPLYILRDPDNAKITNEFYKNFINLLPEYNSNHNSNYTNFLAAIYVKDVLRDMHDGGELNRDILLNLYNTLYHSPLYSELTKKNYGPFSRVKVLSEELLKYIDRNFPAVIKK